MAVLTIEKQTEGSNVWRSPSSVLGHLAIAECNSLTYSPNSCIWDFPCGLAVTEELGAQRDSFARLLGKAHQRHHDEGHLERDWTLVCHVEEEAHWLKQSVTCNCAAKSYLDKFKVDA